MTRSLNHPCSSLYYTRVCVVCWRTGKWRGEEREREREREKERDGDGECGGQPRGLRPLKFTTQSFSGVRRFFRFFAIRQNRGRPSRKHRERERERDGATWFNTHTPSTVKRTHTQRERKQRKPLTPCIPTETKTRKKQKTKENKQKRTSQIGQKKNGQEKKGQLYVRLG